MGAEYKGKKLGTLGDAGFFSLGRGKAVSTVEGGVILTDRDDLSEKIVARLRKVRDYSIIDLIIMLFKSILLSIFLHPALFCIPRAFSLLRLGDTIFDPEFKIKRMSPFQAGLAKNWQVR